MGEIRSKDPSLMKFPVTSSLRASGKKTRTTPAQKTITVVGSKTKIKAKTAKYKRKKKLDEILPVEKMKRSIMVFKIKTASGPPKKINLIFFVPAKVLIT